MNWKLKAVIQNAISVLPSSASYSTYYWVQRHFGGLRSIDPIRKLTAGIETCKRIKELGYDPSERVFLEVGTGRVPLVPMAYWLMGAKRTITIDLNPYLKSELINESLRYIINNQEEVRILFGSLMNENRLEELLHYSNKASFSTRSFLDLCGINYVAPGDAGDTRLPPHNIDFHTSYNVFEHIPLEILKKIIEEGNRIINDNGLLIHKIDYSDHFSQSDKTISPINFLQFSDGEWEKYAGNRYAYVNRLRHDDYIGLFRSAGHNILSADQDVDQRSLELLRSGNFGLNERFKSKSESVLSITGAWIVSKKQ
jgi:hypothetical protein